MYYNFEYYLKSENQLISKSGEFLISNFFLPTT